MRKLFLSVIAIVAISASSVFATAYDAYEIGQLVDENNLRADLGGSLGVLFGNDTIRAAIAVNDGFNIGFASVDDPEKTGTGENQEFISDNTMGGNVYAGIGYKSPMFGAWLGYQVDYQKFATPPTGVLTSDDSSYLVHTPHLQFTAMDNNLRINIPVSIGTYIKRTKQDIPEATPTTYFANEGAVTISTEVQVRYYTGIDYFTAIRLYVRYGVADMKSQKAYENVTDKDLLPANQSSFGIEGRFYFDIPNDGPVAIAPFIKLRYDTVLGGKYDNKILLGNYQYNNKITALNQKSWTGATGATGAPSTMYSPSEFMVELATDFTASSDNGVVTFMGEPFIRSTSFFSKMMNDANDALVSNKGAVTTALTIGLYAELYIYPVENLELYLELDTSYTPSLGGNNAAANLILENVTFSNGGWGLAAGSGVRWYF